MSILYAGIDISKSNFTCSLWLDQAAIDLGEFDNGQDGFKALVAAIAPYHTANKYETVHIIMEATGGYEPHLLSLSRPNLGERRGQRYNSLSGTGCAKV